LCRSQCGIFPSKFLSFSSPAGGSRIGTSSSGSFGVTTSSIRSLETLTYSQTEFSLPQGGNALQTDLVETQQEQLLLTSRMFKIVTHILYALRCGMSPSVGAARSPAFLSGMILIVFSASWNSYFFFLLTSAYDTLPRRADPSAGAAAR